MRFLLLFLLSAPALAANADYVEGEVLVRYRSQASSVARTSLQQSLGGKIMRTLPGRNTVLMKLPVGETVSTAVEKLQKSADVELVQPNYIYRISATVPNDTYYSSLWGVKNTGQTISTGTFGPDTAGSTNNPGTSGRDMDLELAWDRITSCSSVTVAVVDTGIRDTHNDLAANMWNDGSGNHGRNVITNTYNSADDNGHGTHVAGTIGAVGNNGAGTTGVCWGVKLMAIKALGADGSGTSANVAAGVDWAVANGAKVINMSLGSGASDATLEASLEAARVAGVVVITAAGNDGSSNNTTPVYPCNYKKANMVCVAALTQTYALASFSNFGSNYVDVGAPGVNIVSPWPYTFAKTTDDFTTGWTITGSGGTTGFGALTIGSYDTLAVPNNWNGSSATYANSADERAYKDFAFGAYDKIMVEFGVLNNLGAAAGDSLKTYYKVGATDPMTGGTLLDTYTGRTGTNTYYIKSYDITSGCANATCALGYQLTTDATTVDTGALLLDFTLLQLTLANTGYNVIQGTSMAAPHVAGLAAMIMAYQPSYTALNVVESLKNGGEAISSLTLTTTTGKAVNAVGSLSYIKAPASVTLSKE
jgi:subtilisin family serine protease